MAGKNLLINSFKSLSPKQRNFMWSYLDNGGQLVNTCKQLKMNTDTYYRWMTDPVFKKYHDFVIELCTGSLESLAFSALKNGLEANDIKAVRTYYELRGKLKSHQTKIDNTQVKYNIMFGKKEASEVGSRGLVKSE